MNLSDLHPILRTTAPEIIRRYQARFAERELRVLCAHRSPEDQEKVFAEGRSRADGTTTFSPHNFRPSFAVDFCVFVGGKYSAERAHYDPLGSILDEIGDRRLRWGGRFAGLYDGPHVELTPRAVVLEFQIWLQRLGRYLGALDGLWGPQSAAALLAATGCERRTPEAWRKLWTATHEV